MQAHDFGLKVATWRYEIRDCQLRQHIAHRATDYKIEAVRLDGQLRIGDTTGQQGEPDLRLSLALLIEWKHLFDGLLEHSTVRLVEVERPYPPGNADEHLAHREEKEVVIGLVVVANCADRPACFCSKSAHRYRAHALA